MKPQMGGGMGGMLGGLMSGKGGEGGKKVDIGGILGGMFGGMLGGKGDQGGKDFGMGMMDSLGGMMGGRGRNVSRGGEGGHGNGVHLGDKNIHHLKSTVKRLMIFSTCLKILTLIP